MKKILITGGAGYIGSKLATKLVNEGHQVTVLDLMKYNKSSLNHLIGNKKFNLIIGDCCKNHLLKKILKDKDFIIPLAGLVGAPLCDKYPKETVRVNKKSILLLKKLITKNQKIIFLTTNSGYGIGEKNKYCDENSPLRPVSLYGRTKNDAEKIIRTSNNYICFRLATVFGYSYRMRTDLIVNNFVFDSLKTKKIALYEENFRRNFIHVDDVVSAINFSIKNFSKLKNNVYNLGLSSANITKYQLAKLIQKNIKDLKITKMKNKKDPDRRDYFVSNKKIEKKGFKASTSLDDGIKQLIDIFYLDKTSYKNNY